MTRLISTVVGLALSCMIWGTCNTPARGATTIPQEIRDAIAAAPAPAPALLAKYPASRRVTNPVNGHHYQRIDVPLSWRDAQRACEAIGGHLATVTSEEENQFVFSNFGNDHVCWLGATDEAEQGKWRWVTDEPFEYRNWAPNEPSNKGGIEHYALTGIAQVASIQGSSFSHYGFGPQWNDHSLEGQYNGVMVAFPLCEWDATPPAAAEQRLVTVPETGVPEWVAFLQTFQDLRPDTSRTSRQLLWQAPTSMREAATRILKSEKDEFAPASQLAIRVLLEDCIGRMRLSMMAMPMDAFTTMELLDMYLRARLEAKRLDREDAELTWWAVRVAETTPMVDQGQGAVSRWAQRLAASDKAEITDMAKPLEGVVRRLTAVGKPLALQGNSADGSPLDWNAYRGKPVWVVFWKSDQPACRTLLETARWWYDAYHDKGFEVVGVNIDDDRAVVDRYLHADPHPWRTVMDTTTPGTHPMAAYYGITDLPKSFFVDPAGNVMVRDPDPNLPSQILNSMFGEVSYKERLAPPPYAPQGRLTFLDVAAKANRKLTIETFVGEPGNNLAEMPLGEQKLGGVSFQVNDAVIQLGSMYLPELTRSVRGIPVDGQVGRLYFLHGTQWGADPYTVADMTVIGEYQVYYADGTRAKIPIRYGDCVRDWWNIDNSRPTRHADIAWTGENANSRNAKVKLRLYVTQWTNPAPEKKVDHVDLISANTIAAPFCLAITAEEPHP